MVALIRSLWAEPRPAQPPARVRRDWVLVGGLVSLSVLEALLRDDLAWRPAALAVAVVIALSLLWRRSRPLAAVAVAFGAWIAFDVARIALGGVERAVFPESGLYTVAGALVLPYALLRWGAGREAATGLLLILVWLVVTHVADPVGAYEVLVAVGFFLFSAALGAAIRFHANAHTREIEEFGRRSLRVTSDVSDRQSLEGVLNAAIQAFGKVDIMVNSAGRTKRAPTVDFSEDDWNSIIDTNLTGTLRACQVFGRHMLEQESGSIINIASLSTFVALHEVAAYSASKAAVGSLTKSLAVEWSSRGVRVNAIAPGVFRTALNQKLLDETERGREFLLRTPMRRFGNVAELAGAAIFLASDAASFVTGEILAVDGGFLASGVNQ